MVYLIHLSKPIHHARHYLGSADDVADELKIAIARLGVQVRGGVFVENRGK